MDLADKTLNNLNNVSEKTALPYIEMKCMSILLCDNCGKEGARIRHVTRSYGKGKSLFIIENIPIMSCPHCEVSYMTAETLHEIARIKLHKQAIAVEKTVPVAEFA